jgi:hypothetical protein
MTRVYCILCVCVQVSLNGRRVAIGSTDGMCGEKTALFEPFIYEMHDFTKTGLGQT